MLQGDSAQAVSIYYGTAPETDRLQSVAAILAKLDLQEIEGEARTLEVTGDYVYRAGTSAQKAAADLEAVLRRTRANVWPYPCSNEWSISASLPLAFICTSSPGHINSSKKRANCFCSSSSAP
jgi:hypothetical protein